LHSRYMFFGAASSSVGPDPSALIVAGRSGVFGLSAVTRSFVPSGDQTGLPPGHGRRSTCRAVPSGLATVTPPQALSPFTADALVPDAVASATATASPATKAAAARTIHLSFITDPPSRAMRG